MSLLISVSYSQDTTISFRCFIFREICSKYALVILFQETENTQRKIFSNGYSTQTISDFSMGFHGKLEHNWNLHSTRLPTLLCLAGFPASAIQPNPSHMSSRSKGKSCRAEGGPMARLREMRYSSSLFLVCVLLIQCVQNVVWSYIRSTKIHRGWQETICFSLKILWLSIFTHTEVLYINVPTTSATFRTLLSLGLQLSIIALLLKQRQHKFQIPETAIVKWEISGNLGQA